MRISDWTSDVCSSDLDRHRRTRDDIARDAAIFVDLVIIADQADRQRVGRFEQKLAANAPAVAIVDVGIEVQVLRIAIATVVAAAEREGDGVADRAGEDRKSTRLNSSH